MTRGEIYWVEFGIPFGSEPGMRRPAIIVQNDELNECGINTTIVIPLTTNLRFADAPGNLFLDKGETKLPKDSVALLPQTTAIDYRRLREKVTDLPIRIMYEIDSCIDYTFGVTSKT